MSQGTVVVTGMGIASALGTGLAAHRSAMWAARSGIRVVTRFDTAKLRTRLGATWPGWDDRSQPEPGPAQDLAFTARGFPLDELALVAAREAWSSAAPIVEPRRAAMVFGTCFGQGFDEFHQVAQRIASGLDLAGPQITISTACASSTNAIGLARDLLLHGHADVAVAGGADMLLREAFAGFSALGVLSQEPCAPFSEPEGTTLGEGAAFFVLERAGDAARRGIATWCSIRGYGLSADAYHETTPHPSGDGVARAIRGALYDAGWMPGDIDYVSAHATGTVNNDAIEWAVLERDLGRVAVSGSKGHLGHAQGAAGALELCLALLCHREDHVPPTLQFRGARPGCPADPIAQSTPRPLEVSRGLKLSAAFGGANAALAYATRPGRDAPPPARVRKAVVITGAGVVGPAGASAFAGVLDLASRGNAGPCKEVDLDGLGVDGRRLDRSARWLTAAATLALSDHRDSGRLNRTGLFVAATRMPRESARRCVESIRRRGVAGASASAFARMSVNAPAGACTQALGLLGPTTTLTIGEGSGLLAVALAAEWLAWRDDAEAILAAGVDEPRGAQRDEAEGAACLALSRVPGSERGAVVVAAWSIAGPSCAEHAIDEVMRGRSYVEAAIVDGSPSAVAAAGRRVAPLSSLGVIEGQHLWGAAEASHSVVVAAVGAAHVARRDAGSMLLVAASGAASVAVLLERSAG